MSDENRGGHRTQVTVALIALLGAVATGLFANWDKIFPQRSVASPDTTVVEVVPDTVRDTIIVEPAPLPSPQPDTPDSRTVTRPPRREVRDVTCAENQGPSDDPGSNQECSLLEDEVEECQVGDPDSDGVYNEWLGLPEGHSVAFGPWENPNCIVDGVAISGSGWHLSGLGSCGQGGNAVKRCRRVRGRHTVISARPDTGNEAIGRFTT